MTTRRKFMAGLASLTALVVPAKAESSEFANPRLRKVGEEAKLVVTDHDGREFEIVDSKATINKDGTVSMRGSYFDYEGKFVTFAYKQFRFRLTNVPN